MKLQRVGRVLALCGLVVLAVFAQRGPYSPYREKLPDGMVDWDQGWIRADASVPLRKGVPPAQALVEAQRVAMIKAQATALRIAMRLPVNSERRLESYEALRIRIKGIVAGGEVVDEGTSAGVYHISLKVPVNGVHGIVSAVSIVTLPPQPQPPPKEPSGHGEAGGYGQSVKPSEQPPPQQKEEAQAGTGQEGPSDLASFASVTVDATDAGAKPALQPRIIDEKGREVYGVKTVKPLVAGTKTLARYVTPADGGATSSHATWLGPEGLGPLPLALITPPWRLLAQARREPSVRPRGALNSLEVKAVRASGRLKADIVVTEETARKLRELDVRTGALSNGRVTVVVRSDVGGVESRRLCPEDQ
ncbi:MAG: hypothetical protein B7X11_03000, partial [Acidobacteria bacterium 37-65-4]